MVTTQDDHAVIRNRCVSLSLGLGYVGATIGGVILIGWLLDIAILKSLLPGLVTMKANTALGFLLIGSALVLAQENCINARSYFIGGGRTHWPFDNLRVPFWMESWH